MMRIGRNAQCPCGSGRKYKHCCMNKRLEGDDAAPAFQLSMETSTPLNAILARLGTETFETKDALRRRMDELTSAANQSPIDDFLGLSPDQMFRFQHSELFAPESGLELNPELDEKLVENTLIAKIANHVLKAILESGGLKATASKKNFPRKISQEVGQTIKESAKHFERFPFHTSVQSEDDVRPLRLIRDAMTKCGFIKLRKGSFHLTKKGAKTAENGLSATAYHALLTYYLNVVNWGYYDRYPELSELQNFVYFLLFIIHVKADDFIKTKEIAMLFLKAFPQALRSCVEHPL